MKVSKKGESHYKMMTRKAINPSTSNTEESTEVIQKCLASDRSLCARMLESKETESSECEHAKIAGEKNVDCIFLC
jgi:hypothetical protein